MLFWRLLYNLVVIPLGWAGFRLLGIFDRKARRGIKARKRLFHDLAIKVSGLNSDGIRVWFHSSSLGEFEQAKPIIAELKRRRPELQIIVSFFSPSGFEHSQSYKLASIITYIPVDSARNARKFVDLIRPAAAVIVRYDLWPNHLWTLQSLGIPTFIANATLGSMRSRKLPIARQFYQKLFNGIDYILTVSAMDRAAYESFHLVHPTIDVIGDTRYDQVWQRSIDSRTKHVIDPQILRNRKILVIGSSWKEDEEIILPACRTVMRSHPEFIVILVPHEPTVENLERIEGQLDGDLRCIRFSDLHEYGSERMILIDSVGILMVVYQYGHFAFVGGSFRGGVHNVLEPAAYGIPVLFGPKYQNSQEAVEMVESEGGLTGNDSGTFANHLEELLTDEALRRRLGTNALALVRRNTGATERFIAYFEKIL